MYFISIIMAVTYPMEHEVETKAETIPYVARLSGKPRSLKQNEN